MSFSSEIKEELAKQISSARHCQIAELAALIMYCGEVKPSEKGRIVMEIQTENWSVFRKYFTLLRKAFNIDTDIAEAEVKEHSKNNAYTYILEDPAAVHNVLQAIKRMDRDEMLPAAEGMISPLIMKNSCCRRSILRGAYLAIGSMSNPVKSYHFELACAKEAQAVQLRDIIIGFGVEAKIVIRKKYHVVYVKEGSGIVDLLNIMEAHVALMKFENLRIVKEMRNTINRRVNCEAANITKTVHASSKQIEDILSIRNAIGFNNIQDSLCEMAEIRLEHPDDTLKELGQYLNPPVGKSGVNHRLRKLSELADKLK